MGRLSLIRLLHIIHRCNDTQMAVIRREKLGRKRAVLVGKLIELTPDTPCLPLSFEESNCVQSQAF